MKTRFNNRELCHVWANQSQPNGTGSNMFFENEKIYSYGKHFEIARIVQPNNGYGGIILFNSASYSNTTAKHKSYVNRAIDTDTYKVFVVPFFEVSRYGDNITWFKNSVNEVTKKAARARDNKEWLLRQVESTIAEMLLFIKMFNLPKDGEVEQMEIQLNEHSILTPEILAELKAKDQARKQVATAKKKVEISEWLNGENRYLHSLDETYLRVKGEVVETSHGANVPLREAKLLYIAIETGKPPVHGFKIGNYTVNSWSGGVLKIGCYKLKENEINRFAAAQGWS